MNNIIVTINIDCYECYVVLYNMYKLKYSMLINCINNIFNLLFNFVQKSK